MSNRNILSTAGLIIFIVIQIPGILSISTPYETLMAIVTFIANMSMLVIEYNLQEYANKAREWDNYQKELAERKEQGWMRVYQCDKCDNEIHVPWH